MVVPRGDIEIDDTWRVLGMRGTGSKDVVAHGVFVPAYRTIDTRKFFLGQSPHIKQSSDQPLTGFRPKRYWECWDRPRLLGSAKFALRKFIEHTQQRRVIITGARKAEYVPTQLRLAEAAREIESRRPADA